MPRRAARLALFVTSPLLFSPVTLPAPEGQGLTLLNRALVPPMCQYAVDAEDGVPTDWHLVHTGAMAAGGFGLVTVEATGVEARGRISPRDLGLWDDAQVPAHARLTAFAHTQGAAIAVQLGHAGGKASTYPWLPGASEGTVPAAEGGWATVSATAQPTLPELDAPAALDAAGLDEVVEAFASAARRADAAGYDAVQIHAAHGYLLHQFLSPITNTRTDEYGGDEAGRTRLLLRVVDAVRAAWPAHKPLGIRLSASDWTEGEDGTVWDARATARLARTLVAEHGVGWIDVSSGGLAGGRIPVGPGYQVPLAQAVTEALAGTQAVVSAVGLIEEAAQAETILATGQAHAVSIGRAALRDPHWAASAASTLGVPAKAIHAAPQYWRARF